jgi:hypothetical protein
MAALCDGCGHTQATHWRDRGPCLWELPDPHAAGCPCAGYVVALSLHPWRWATHGAPVKVKAQRR